MANLYYLAKQGRFLVNTHDNWIEWALGKQPKFMYTSWKRHNQLEYELMLEHTKLAQLNVLPSARLVAIELMRSEGEICNGYKDSSY